jgi:replicative DNA helicase
MNAEESARELALLVEAVYGHARYTTYAIRPEWYESPTHQAIALAVESAAVLGASGLDAVCVELQRAGRLERLEGKMGVHRLLSSSRAAPDPKDFLHRRRCRLVRDVCLKAASSCEQGELQEALSAVDRVAELLADGGQTITGTECIQRTLVSLKTQANRIHPGLEPIENAIGSLPIGSLTIVGAQTSVGKSTICLETILAACARNVRAGYISREDPDDIVGSRILAAESGVSSRSILTGQALEHDMHKLSVGVARVANYGDRLLVDNDCGGDEIGVMAAMSRMAARGVKLVVVDYLQNISGADKKQDRRNEIRLMCTHLKSHAKRLGMALILVSQLSRPQKGKENNEPTKHDLRETGDLEAAAEVILLLWRKVESDKAAVHVRVAKCKWGGLGQVFAMKRHPETMRLEAYDGVDE